MITIITDLEQNAKKDEFVKWYDYCTELGMLGVENLPNYKFWLRGCPRKTEAEIEEIKSAHKKVEDAKKILTDLIERGNESRF